MCLVAPGCVVQCSRSRHSELRRETQSHQLWSHHRPGQGASPALLYSLEYYYIELNILKTTFIFKNTFDRKSFFYLKTHMTWHFKDQVPLSLKYCKMRHHQLDLSLILPAIWQNITLESTENRNKSFVFNLGLRKYSHPNLPPINCWSQSQLHLFFQVFQVFFSPPHLYLSKCPKICNFFTASL